MAAADWSRSTNMEAPEHKQQPTDNLRISHFPFINPQALSESRALKLHSLMNFLIRSDHFKSLKEMRKKTLINNNEKN